MVAPDGSHVARPRVAMDGPAVEVPRTPRTWHVWVSLGHRVSQPDRLYPGLVLAWRRGSQGWEAWTLWVTVNGASEPGAHADWLPAHRLHPVEYVERDGGVEPSSRFGR